MRLIGKGPNPGNPALAEHLADLPLHVVANLCSAILESHGAEPAARLTADDLKRRPLYLHPDKRDCCIWGHPFDARRPNRQRRCRTCNRHWSLVKRGVIPRSDPPMVP